jgi:hypothetical protein
MAPIVTSKLPGLLLFWFALLATVRRYVPGAKLEARLEAGNVATICVLETLTGSRVTPAKVTVGEFGKPEPLIVIWFELLLTDAFVTTTAARAVLAMRKHTAKPIPIVFIEFPSDSLGAEPGTDGPQPRQYCKVYSQS